MPVPHEAGATFMWGRHSCRRQLPQPNISVRSSRRSGRPQLTRARMPVPPIVYTRTLTASRLRRERRGTTAQWLGWNLATNP